MTSPDAGKPRCADIATFGLPEGAMAMPFQDMAPRPLFRVLRPLFAALAIWR